MIPFLVWNDILTAIDWFTNTAFSVFNWYKQNGGILFYITITLVVIYPILRKIVRAMRGGR